MSTKLDIVNKTFIKLGCETITDLNTNSKPVRLINTIYDSVKNEELQKHNWIFAKRKKTIYACDLVDTVENVGAIILDDVDLSVDKNILNVVAKTVGTSGNDIVISCSSNKVKCSSVKLVGGSVTQKAKGYFCFNDNIVNGDTITIGNTTLTAGIDFVLGKTQDGQFKRKFLFPKNLLLLLDIEDFGPLTTSIYQYGARTAYDVCDDTILCNRPIITINYTAYVDDEKLDVNFVDVLACKLAVELCEAICQSENKNKFFIEKYLLAIKDAKRVNAIQMPNACLSSGSLERARL